MYTEFKREEILTTEVKKKHTLTFFGQCGYNKDSVKKQVKNNNLKVLHGSSV